MIDNHDDSIARLKNMLGKIMGGWKWKLPAAFEQWRYFVDRLPRANLREVGDCSLRQSTGSIWRLRLCLTERRPSDFFVLSHQRLSSSHILRRVVSSLRETYTCAVLSERLQALVAELREVKMLRKKLRHLEARTIGKRRHAKPGRRARPAN